MLGLTRLRLIEIVIALVLTLAALFSVGLAVWTSEVKLTEAPGPK